MTPASIGRLRRVGGLDVRVPDYPGGAVVSLVREDGLLWMGDTAEGRALAQHILAACDQADAEARNRRDQTLNMHTTCAQKIGAAVGKVPAGPAPWVDYSS